MRWRRLLRGRRAQIERVHADVGSSAASDSKRRHVPAATRRGRVLRRIEWCHTAAASFSLLLLMLKLHSAMSGAGRAAALRQQSAQLAQLEQLAQHSLTAQQMQHALQSQLVLPVQLLAQLHTANPHCFRAVPLLLMLLLRLLLLPPHPRCCC